MSHPICHDLKTPRPDASGRLPSAYLLLPILFYVSVLGGIAYNINSYANYRNAQQERDSWTESQAEKEAAKVQLEARMAGLNVDTQKAERLAEWIEGTRTFQPICVAVTRSIPEDITLGDLSLERSPDMPAQINISVRINNGSMEEVAKIQNALQSLNYRPYNSQELRNEDDLEYRTMLVWQQP